MKNKDMKKVSLVLTTFNCKENLKKTLESIEKQDYLDVEIIIKDGGSKDGTLEIILEYQENSKYEVKWESKPDKGIFDAMNQGYRLTTGDVLLFFNDVFTTSNVISKMISKMETINPITGKEYIGVHADLIYADGGKIIRKWHTKKADIRLGWIPGHPTLFLKREIYEKYGLYDPSFKIGADYEFMIRILKDKENQLAYVPEVMVSMFYGGTSSGGLKSYVGSFKEVYRALQINRIKGVLLIDIMRTITVLKQFI